MESESRSWRPQAFGRRRARDVRDPLVEPGWDGVRVLVHVGPGERVVIDDVEGKDIAPACVEIALAIRDVTEAESATLDGYLTVQATQPAGSGLPDAGLMPSLRGQMTRFVIGSAGDILRAERPERPSGVVRGGPDLGLQGRSDLSRSAAERDPGEEMGDADAPGATPVNDADPAQGDESSLPAADEPATDDPDQAPRGALAFVAIDLLAVDGTTIVDVPLLERKRLLESVLGEGSLVRRTPFVREPATTFIRTWREAGFGELAYKDPNSRYRPGAPNDGWAIAPMPRG